MNKLIESILFIEESAKSVIEDANNFINTLSEQHTENMVIMETQINEMANKKIKTLTEESIKEKKKKIQEIEENKQKKLKHIEEKTAKNIDIWSKKIITEILGDKYIDKNHKI
jgi:rRNA maturation endonuclease Nob1